MGRKPTIQFESHPKKSAQELAKKDENPEKSDEETEKKAEDDEEIEEEELEEDIEEVWSQEQWKIYIDLI